MAVKYTHVIWDWNGTLINDVALCVEIVNQLLKEQNKKPLTVEKYRNIFDFPVKKYYQKAGFDFSTETFEQIGGRFINTYNKRCNQASLQPGAKEILLKISQSNITQSVLSARKQDYLQKDIANFGLTQLLTDAWGINNHYANGKIETGLTYIESSKIKPEQTLLIGDTLHDVDVASKMGIQSILVTNGHQDYERLLTANVPLFQNLNEVSNFLWKPPK